jgi:DNA polymerase
MSRHGPVIVHNCILGLGFGMGPPKFKATLALGTNGPVVHVEDGEAIRVVQAYRRRFHRIPHLWDRMENALMCMASGRVLDDGFIQVKDGKLWLPNGMAIQYHDLHREDGGWVFLHRKKPTKTYGGKATENLIQGLAKIVVADQMLEIQKHAPVKLMVHDEPVMIVPEKDAEEVAKIVEQIMSTPPEWAPGLPVACESGWGKSFGEC